MRTESLTVPVEREMASDSMPELTALIADVSLGREGACDRLAAAVYTDLRAMAERRLTRRYGRNLAGVTIQPTVLASDTLMRLIRNRKQYDNRGHFFAIASREMFQVLIDYDRHRQAAKRAAGIRVSFDPLRHDIGERKKRDAEVEALHEALQRLAHLDARKADVVRYHVLWELTNNEVADVLNVSLATVERDWAFAKTWLAKELRGDAR